MRDENFLAITIKSIEDNHHTVDEVYWVGTKDGKYGLHWLDFTLLANFDYDSGYGVPFIPMNLVVVGKDWWLERHEYDGSEWWEYKQLPILHPDHQAWLWCEDDKDSWNQAMCTLDGVRIEEDD